MKLDSPLIKFSGVYKKYSARLEKLGIRKIEDFLYHIPSRYENFSLVSDIKNIQPGETVTVRGRIVKIENNFLKGGKKLQKALISDGTATIEGIWFNQPYLLRIIKKGDDISVSGKVTYFNKPVIQIQEYELGKTADSSFIHTGRLIPIYPETQGISSKWIRRQVFNILSKKEKLIEYLPDSIIKNEDLMEINSTIEQIHFPISLENAEKARMRLMFDELFLLSLSVLSRKKELENREFKTKFLISKYNKQIESFLTSLPFELTDAQKRVVSEITSDLSLQKPMNRLLEGEVGSGKTVVAAIAMYISYLNGYQSALMAPTEILANQHFKTIESLLSSYGIKVKLTTSSVKLKDSFDILVGTHSMLYGNINFKNLGLVVIDEQHRFGVRQRALIREKGLNPHVLTMTATPIPRTIALTLYGDLDLSLLDQVPKERKRIKTWLVPVEKREDAYKWIRSRVKSNKDQVFIICPFIEESESIETVKAAKKEYEKLKESVFSDLKLGLLHGKLKSEEKNKVLDLFKKGETQILVATPVVEVGIDVRSATIMLIEGAERFGLAQLHQLRGRVGRGDKQSYCLLFTESDSQKTLERLKSMERIFFGPELAEIDLKLRGPGEIYGTLQHGRTPLKIASFSDFELIEKTKKEALKIFPKLSDYKLLKEKVTDLVKKDIAPD
jgi:ATP-dependent DNA helicase RecG